MKINIRVRVNFLYILSYILFDGLLFRGSKKWMQMEWNIWYKRMYGIHAQSQGLSSM